jgi:hypothetical protein
MKLEGLTTVNLLAAFLSGIQTVAYSVIGGKDDCYCWIQGAWSNFAINGWAKEIKAS